MKIISFLASLYAYMLLQFIILDCCFYLQKTPTNSNQNIVVEAQKLRHNTFVCNTKVEKIGNPSHMTHGCDVTFLTHTLVFNVEINSVV